MSFWIDEEDDAAAGAGKPSRLSSMSQLTTRSSSSQQIKVDEPSAAISAVEEAEEGAFDCENCGGSDFYIDNTTSLQVCSQCFTQSQAGLTQNTETDNNTTMMDYDEVIALAAKTKHGHLVKRRGPGDGSWRLKGSEKLPLEPLDKSTAIPDLETCLMGCQQILKVCAVALSDLLFSVSPAIANSNDGDRSEKQRQTVQQTVRTLWMNYLRSWSDGAEWYGKQYPDVRFSLRDHFLPQGGGRIRKKILRYLSYKVTQKIRKEQNSNGDDNNAVHEMARTCDETQNNTKRRKRKVRDPIFDDSDDESGGGSVDIPPSPDHPVSATTARALAPLQSRSAAKPTRTTTNVRTGGGHKVIINLLEERRRDTGQWHDHKDAALFLVPSMTFIGSLLWVAVARSGVTPVEIARWIADDRIPLLNAFRLLTVEQQEALLPIATYFKIKGGPPSPATIEYTGDLISVAAGLKKGCQTVCSDHSTVKRARFRWLLPSSIPAVALSIVEELQLGQTVLDYSLALLGLGEKPSAVNGLPPRLLSATSDLIHSIPHLLAVIACAAQLDPDWRQRLCCQTSRSSRRARIPWNNVDAKSMRNCDFQVYKEFAENAILKKSEDSLPFSNGSATENDGDNTETRVDVHDGHFVSRRNYEPDCDAFRLLVLECVNKGGKRRAKSRALVFDEQQDLLMESLASVSRVETKLIIVALPRVLGLGPGSTSSRRRTTLKQEDGECEIDTPSLYACI